MDTHDPAEAAGSDPASEDALLSLLAFWADAGVETAFEDAPVNRLSLPPTRAARPVPETQAPPTAQAGLRPSIPPDAAGEIARARAAAGAAVDIASLQAAIDAFETPLRPRGAPVVFARGELAAPLVAVIGQGPSAEDEAVGSPFSGAAGRLLDRMLAAAGLDGRALILSTACWRAGPRGGSQADVEAVCAPFLERALTLARPRALLIAGDGALRSLTGPGDPVTRARGRWMTWRPAGDDAAEPLPALPILAPEVLLRHPAGKKLAWADLMSLAERLAQA